MIDIDNDAIKALEEAVDARVNALTKSSESTHIAEVLRTDSDGTTWVHIFGGASETPATASLATVKSGDLVYVTISDGRVTVNGSTSSPSTTVSYVDEADQKTMETAVEARKSAFTAAQAAEEAVISAGIATDAANDAQASANQAILDAAAASSAASIADGKAVAAGQAAEQASQAASVADGKAVAAGQAASAAQASATAASTAAATAQTNASTALQQATAASTAAAAAQESASVATANAENATESAATASIAANLALNNLATTQDVVAAMGTDLDDLQTHVAMTNQGLHIVPMQNGYSVLLSTSSMKVLDPLGDVVAEYGEGFRVGRLTDTHLVASGDRLSFVSGDGVEVAYIEVDSETNESMFHITRAVVMKDLRFGNWKWADRSNGNLALKWVGETLP